MRVSLTILLLAAFIVPAKGQDVKKIAGKNIRSSERIVKGAPFSAETISENVQILADGNRILRRSISRIYRDSEGRFRRENMPKQCGVPGGVVEMPESIEITDPRAVAQFVLNPKNNTFRHSVFKLAFDWKLQNEKLKLKAEKLKLDNELTRKSREVARVDLQAKRKEQRALRQENLEDRRKKIAERNAELEMGDVRSDPKRDAKIETLGVQNIEGVTAEGTRTTTTIPAGAIGNELPIEVVYERWYSQDLQMIVLSRHTDPRFGEQTYRLSNIGRTEPPISLFSPPGDYKLADEKSPKPRAVPEPKALPADKALPAKPAAAKKT